MQVGDVVTLTDARGEHTGKVVVVHDKSTGMLTVEWDSGVKEKIHASEVKKIGFAPVAPVPDDSGYELDDPKHPTFYERLAALWDSRPGK